MKVIGKIGEMQAIAGERRRLGEPIGFVPTMGALHEGHLSLVRLAKARVPWVVVSIFVNPTQFGPGEDYERYPRDLEADCRLLEAEGCDVVFAPTADAMYPEGHRTRVVVDRLQETLCGRTRPGHFDGVATIVLKLFHIVRPDVAVFGQKDAQQLVILRRMVEDLNLGIEIVAGPTVREADGLAGSSRNRYLSQEERRQATCLHRALLRAEELFRSGERNASNLVQEMQRIIDAEPAAEAEYVSVVDPRTLEDLETVTGGALVALAVRIGKTRLIDNTQLETETSRA